jgi:hypothetical protein
VAAAEREALQGWHRQKEQVRSCRQQATLLLR